MLKSGLALISDSYAVFSWRVPLLAALTITSALLEGFSLALLLPLLQIMGVGGDGNRVTHMANSAFVWLGMTTTPASIGMALGGLLAASVCVFLAQAYLSTRLQSEYVAIWQERIFDAVMSAEWIFLRQLRSGDLVGALSTEAARIGGAFYQANLIVSSVVFLLVQIAIAAVLAPLVTIALLVLAAVLFRATEQMVRRAVRIGGELTEANGALFATVGEVAASMKTIKATGGEGETKIWLGRHVAAIRELTFRNAFDVQLVRAIFEYASTGGIIALLVLGPLFFHIDVASVLIVTAIFVRLFPKVTGLRQCLQSIGLVLPAFDASRYLLLDAKGARERIHGGAHIRSPDPATVELRDILVKGDAAKPILEDVNVAIPAGSHVAFVGPTGAGKTTLMDCVLGLLTPARGQVVVDGRDLAELDLAGWRSVIGYIGQEPVMLAGSVRDNVAWNRKNFADCDIEEALRAANAGFVFALPGGIGAGLSERGANLSGGERQRIALARAFLGAPRLLVMDEATSALDVETEQGIIEAIRRRHGEVTVLSITHRLSSARAADRIVVLEGGRVVEQGCFNELLVAHGRFAAMWRAQDEHRDASALARAES